MKITVDLPLFQDIILKYGYGSLYSLEGLRIVFEHVELLEYQTGVENELEPVLVASSYIEVMEEGLEEWENAIVVGETSYKTYILYTGTNHDR